MVCTHSLGFLDFDSVHFRFSEQVCFHYVVIQLAPTEYDQKFRNPQQAKFVALVFVALGEVHLLNLTFTKEH